MPSCHCGTEIESVAIGIRQSEQNMCVDQPKISWGVNMLVAIIVVWGQDKNVCFPVSVYEIAVIVNYYGFLYISFTNQACINTVNILTHSCMNYCKEMCFFCQCVTSDLINNMWLKQWKLITLLCSPKASNTREPFLTHKLAEDCISLLSHSLTLMGLQVEACIPHKAFLTLISITRPHNSETVKHGETSFVRC